MKNHLLSDKKRERRKQLEILLDLAIKYKCSNIIIGEYTKMLNSKSLGLFDINFISTHDRYKYFYENVK